MKRSILAAALAAGMMPFAVHAEAHLGALSMQAAAAAPIEAPTKADKAPEKRKAGEPGRRGQAPTGSREEGKRAAAHKAAKRAAADKAAKREERAPGVDRMKTASIKAGKSPELVAKARKSTKGKAEALTGDVAASPAGGKYQAIVARYASAYGVSPALAHAVIRIESNYRPGVVGSAGEIGLMQIKPSTARGIGYSGSAKGLHNPETNIKFGIKYLSMAQKLGGGSTCGTILKYNAGHGAKRMNPVSAAYCSKVKRLMGS